MNKKTEVPAHLKKRAADRGVDEDTLSKTEEDELNFLEKGSQIGHEEEDDFGNDEESE